MPFTVSQIEKAADYWTKQIELNFSRITSKQSDLFKKTLLEKLYIRARISNDIWEFQRRKQENIILECSRDHVSTDIYVACSKIGIDGTQIGCRFNLKMQISPNEKTKTRVKHFPRGNITKLEYGENVNPISSSHIISEISKELASSRKENETLRNQLSASTAENSSLKAELAEIKARVTELENKRPPSPSPLIKARLSQLAKNNRSEVYSSVSSSSNLFSADKESKSEKLPNAVLDPKERPNPF